MNNILVGCFLMLMCTIGCTKTIEQPVVTLKEMRNCIVDIQNCPSFIKDSPGIYMALTAACVASGFKNYTARTESIEKDVWVLYVYAEHGYAALWVHKKDTACTLEFCCRGNEYCYADFLDTFMNEFYSIERGDEWYQTFTELLE